MRILFVLLMVFAPFSGWSQGSIKSNAKKEIGVSFANLKEGDTLSSPFKVKFEVHGMAVKPAGTIEKDTGHHHLLVNTGPVLKGPIPADDKHIHFGKGQTETELTLPSGKHTLTLQFADGAHISYGPKWSKTLTINVK